MWGSAVFGAVFLVVAWVTKNHHPHIRRINWDWVHAALMLVAGICFGPIVARLFTWAFGWLTTFWGNTIGGIGGLPDWLHALLLVVPKALPWSAGAAIVLMVVFHMAPKVGKGIHSSTPWLAFLAPAAVLFFPPLFSLVSGG
jgi:hypothetical protein